MSINQRQIVLVKSRGKTETLSGAKEQLRKKIAKARSDLKRAQRKVELYKSCAALHTQRRNEIVIPEIGRYYQNLKQWVLALVRAQQQFKWSAIEYDAIGEQIEAALRVLVRELSGDDEIMALVEEYCTCDQPNSYDGNDSDEADDFYNDDEDLSSQDINDAGQNRDQKVKLFIARVCMQFGLDPDVFNDCQTMDQVAYILHAQIGARGKDDSSKASQPKKNKPISIRELYRKLASALHPDKESDANIRAEKTELMKKLNNAYRDNDIETLMAMQLELTQSESVDLVSDDEVLKLTLEHVKSQIAKLKLQAEEFVSKMPRVSDIKKVKKLADIEPVVEDLIDAEISSLLDDQMLMQNEIKYYFHSKKALRPKVRLWIGGIDGMLD
jgi:hypothetical protein